MRTCCGPVTLMLSLLGLFMQCRASGSTMRALVDYLTPNFTLQPAEYHAPGLKAPLSNSISRNTSAWRAPPLQRLHVGTHSRPIIQQDRSSEAIVSAISQLHLLFVLLAILRSSRKLKGHRAQHPTGSIQRGSCVCNIATAPAGRLVGAPPSWRPLVTL